jgi:hypothetical protein
MAAAMAREPKISEAKLCQLLEVWRKEMKRRGILTEGVDQLEDCAFSRARPR